MPGESNIEAFDNIECITIDRIFKYFRDSNGQLKHRYANIGLFTIDLKLLQSFKTNEPENIEFHGSVKRGFSHFRTRPKSKGISSGKGMHGSIRSGLGCTPFDQNFLGKEWRRFYNKSDLDYPTFNRILNGIIQESKN